jgi:hypothetical protein
MKKKQLAITKKIKKKKSPSHFEAFNLVSSRASKQDRAIALLS